MTHNLKSKDRIGGSYVMKALSTVTAFCLLIVSCSKEDEVASEPIDPAQPAFSMTLDLNGGLETTLPGEEVFPTELNESTDTPRAAQINLRRDKRSRSFKINMNVQGGLDLPVVVACRYTEGRNITMYLAKTTMHLLAKNNRTFRIEQKGVGFYELNANGSKKSSTATQTLPSNGKGIYEVKLFVGASLQDVKGKDGVTRYTIGYGLDKTENKAELVMMDSKGEVSIDNVLGKIPFVSQWNRVHIGRNDKSGEIGLTNNEAAHIKDLNRFVLKPEGSILMFELKNVMTKTDIKLRKVRVYSERLTTNIAYAFDERMGRFQARPAAYTKAGATEVERYLNGVWDKPQNLEKKTGTKTFFFWAKHISTDYISADQWAPTSIVAHVEESKTDGKKYWLNVPLLKLYDPLSRLLDAQVTKTVLKFEDGTPIHPMNLMAHRFFWNLGGNATMGRYKWRGDTDSRYYVSAYYDGGHGSVVHRYAGRTDWNEQWLLNFNGEEAKRLRTEGVEMPFGRVDQVNPMVFQKDGGVTNYRFRTPSIRQLSAIFPTGQNKKQDIEKTNSNTPVIIQERAQMEQYKGDTDFYTIIQRVDNHRTYAIRFLRKDGDLFYMTPYTAAYRYDRKSVWQGNGKLTMSTSNNLNSTIEIRMRSLGSSTYQYNEHDTQYHSPRFSEQRLRELFSIVTEVRFPEPLTHDRWWQDNPLKEDDVVREYPALGYLNRPNDPYFVGSNFNVMVVNDKNVSYVFGHGRQYNFNFDFHPSSSKEYAPIILLADREIVQ